MRESVKKYEDQTNERVHQQQLQEIPARYRTNFGRDRSEGQRPTTDFNFLSKPLAQ